MQRDRFDQTALEAAVNFEGRRRLDRTILAVEHWVDLGERDALDGQGNLNEIARLGFEVRQTIEAADFPACLRVRESKLCDRERPTEIGKVAFAFDMLRYVDPIQTCE